MAGGGGGRKRPAKSLEEQTTTAVAGTKELVEEQKANGEPKHGKVVESKKIEPGSKRPRSEPKKGVSKGVPDSTNEVGEETITSSPANVATKTSVQNSDEEEEEEAVWNRMFFRLMLFKANAGTFHVKSNDKENADLNKWIIDQRRQYKFYQTQQVQGEEPEQEQEQQQTKGAKKKGKVKCYLTEDRVKVMDSIRFSFSTRGDDHWNRNFEKLQEYKNKHGHCLVPRHSEFAGLGDWVIIQRTQYKDHKQGKKTPITPRRIEMLDELGFMWKVRNRPGWSSKFEELLEYKKKYGDTRVPQHFPENKALGKWVAKQREQYKFLQLGKHSFLTPDRLEKLNSVGFVWAVRGDVIAFDEKSPDEKIGLEL